MVRTKQMPRNPIMERPITAMGSDVQGKGYLPSLLLEKPLKEESNLASICCINHSNIQPLDGLKNLIDTILVY